MFTAILEEVAKFKENKQGNVHITTLRLGHLMFTSPPWSWQRFHSDFVSSSSNKSLM